ncbi:MAG: PEP-CTERM sorting domain-containing protein [Armatimonadetes bacterium]|nr:PEP-CTERM sorting domain-containing protein [Armatimonadota bacterium]
MNKILLTSAAAMALSAGAHAVNLNIQSMQPGLYQTVTINFNGNNQTVYAGAQKVSIDGGPGTSLYCVDLGHANHFGDSYNANVQGLNTLSNGNLVGNLMTNFWSTLDTSTEAAAFQLALWDAVVDGGDGLNAGNFKGVNVSAALSNQFSIYKAAMNNAGPENLMISVYNAVDHGPYNKDHQNLIGAESVPEPATMAILGVAAAFAARRRKR